MRLDFKNIQFSYSDIPVLKDFNLALESNSINALLGTSGCGKTTLLKLAAGLLKPSAGNILFDNQDAALLSAKQEQVVSFVFQESRLLPWRTVQENVAIALEPLYDKKKAMDIAVFWLEKIGLEEKKRVFPAELSGGQRQRVSIARAFAWPSNLLLMDEPFQSLDIPLRVQLIDVTRSLLQENPRTVLMVTHDPREALYFADRILVMGEDGRSLLLDEMMSIDPLERRYSSSSLAKVESNILSALEGAS